MTTGRPAPTVPKRIFVDTQGWAEAFHLPALHHAQAETLLRTARADQWELITSNMILSELVPLFRSRLFRLSQPHVLNIVTQIRALPNVTIMHVDSLIDQQAWGLLYSNPQQPWSHVDATSMVLMHQLGLTEVFSADRHFEQAGFTVLL
jgi:predicted nucleic acid-binding protein